MINTKGFRDVLELGREIRYTAWITDDNGRISSIDISINKAFTAAAARKSTRAYGEVSGPGKPAFGIHTSNQGRFMIFAGGLPLFIDGRIVGGIGCNSGSPDQDETVAQAGIDALKAFLKP